MNFRSIGDLDQCIVSNLHKIPHDVDLIVGIPRSGMLAASILALYMNLPLTDLDGFLAGRMFNGGNRLEVRNGPSSVTECRKVLIVDDSVRSGQAMRAARRKIEKAQTIQDVIYLAVYATPDATGKVDIYLEICPLPRVFSWNVMHRDALKYVCMDIDGVLCRDPQPEENDDGPRYLEFLKTVEPMFLPTYPVGYLVTNRLEKYREATEAWLQEHNVVYGKLFMMDLPDKVARRASGAHALFKATVYRNTDANIFIESSRKQAGEIARLSGKPVLCIESQKLISPPGFYAGQLPSVTTATIVRKRKTSQKLRFAVMQIKSSIRKKLSICRKISWN